MDFSNVTAVLLCCTLLVYRGLCSLCYINLTALTADCSGQGLYKIPSYVPNSVETLNLQFNWFEEVDLRQFRRFQNLEELNLKLNRVAHLINDSDAELPTLRVLDISDNRLQDLNSAFFVRIPNLQKLSIKGNFLEVSMFKGLRNLTYLDMSWNQPINFNSTPFMELEYLEDLNLQACGLKNLKDTMFTGLSNLLKLKLGWNALQYLPSGVFDGLTILKVLDLSHNWLHYNTSLPTDIFQPLVHLEELHVNAYMNYPFYANYTYLDTQISKITTLKRLYITGAPNTKFGPRYTDLRNLEYLNISGNLSEINNETFINLRYTHSLTLSLVDCQFSSISPNALTSLINLTSLDVSSNDFLCKQTMWRNFTTGICNSKLKYLTATYLCAFEFIPRWPCDAPDLEFLDMSYNNMYNLVFVTASLKELHLNNNNIDFINLLTLIRMHYLRKLDLSDQIPVSAYSNTHLKKGIKRIARDSTNQYKLYTVSSAPIYNITTKKYANFNITAQNVQLKDRNMTFKDKGLNTETRSTRGRYPINAFLEWIDLSKGWLMCNMYKFDFTNNSVKTLILSKLRPSRYCSIDIMLKRLWSLLDNLTKLENFDLSGNHITDIPVGAFMHTTQLKYLHLSRNHLVTLTFEIKALWNLKELCLSDNIIQYASSRFMTDIKSNDLKIYLDGNKLLCDCERSSFAHWLSTTNAVYNITGLMCKYENGSQVSLRHRAAIYQQLKGECIYVIVTVTCVLTFIFFLIGGFCVAILLHKRWKEQYLSVFGRRSVNPYHPLEECQIELEYDIYISYERDHDITAHETMHDFVTKKLYPWLKRRGFKVLIRDELYAGRKLYAEISEALRKTRNVIVFLSNDYCLDFWNVFEFNTAAMEGIYTKRHVIIPVTFEILNPVVFHEEITAFLKSGPLPRYTPNTNFTELTDHLIEKLSC